MNIRENEGNVMKRMLEPLQKVSLGAEARKNLGTAELLNRSGPDSDARENLGTATLCCPGKGNKGT